MSKAAELHTVTNPNQKFSINSMDGNVQERIEQRAYELYEARGSEPGHELEDWIKAEAEILRQGSSTLHRAA